MDKKPSFKQYKQTLPCQYQYFFEVLAIIVKSSLLCIINISIDLKIIHNGTCGVVYAVRESEVVQ